jgi:hypothetical protein
MFRIKTFRMKIGNPQRQQGINPLLTLRVRIAATRTY